MNSTKITEQQNPNSMNIDLMGIDEILETINKDDEKVAIAVKKAIPETPKASMLKSDASCNVSAT